MLRNMWYLCYVKGKVMKCIISRCRLLVEVLMWVTLHFVNMRLKRLVLLLVVLMMLNGWCRLVKNTGSNPRNCG